MEIKDLTIGQAIELTSMFGGAANNVSTRHPYTIGQPYFIRTVTNYYTGRLVEVFDQELVLEDVAWIADTGRFANSMRNLDLLNEVEPFPDGRVVIGRGAILDAHITSSKLPREQK